MGIEAFAAGVCLGAAGGVAYQRQRDRDLLDHDAVTTVTVTDPASLATIEDLRLALAGANKTIADLAAQHEADQARLTALADEIRGRVPNTLASSFTARLNLAIPGFDKDLPTVSSSILYRSDHGLVFCGRQLPAISNWYISQDSAGYKRLRMLQPGLYNCTTQRFVNLARRFTNENPVATSILLTGTIQLSGVSYGLGEAFPRLCVGCRYGDGAVSANAKLKLDSAACPQLDDSGLKVLEYAHLFLAVGRVWAKDTIEIMVVPNDQGTRSFEQPRTKAHFVAFTIQAVEGTVDGLRVDAAGTMPTAWVHLQANGVSDRRTWWTNNYQTLQTYGVRQSYINAAKWTARQQFGSLQSAMTVTGTVTTPPAGAD